MCFSPQHRIPLWSLSPTEFSIERVVFFDTKFTIWVVHATGLPQKHTRTLWARFKCWICLTFIADVQSQLLENIGVVHWRLSRDRPKVEVEQVEENQRRTHLGTRMIEFSKVSLLHTHTIEKHFFVIRFLLNATTVVFILCYWTPYHLDLMIIVWP